MFIPLLNRFLHWMIVGVMSPILVLMLLSKGVALESVGAIMALLSVSVIAFELPSGVLSDRIGRKTMYLVALALFFAGFLAMLVGRGFWPLSLGMCLFGLGRAFSSGSIEADFIDHYLERHGKDRLHRLMAGMGVAETLGLALGAAVGGACPSSGPGWRQGTIPTRATCLPRW